MHLTSVRRVDQREKHTDFISDLTNLNGRGDSIGLQPNAPKRRTYGVPITTTSGGGSSTRLVGSTCLIRQPPIQDTRAGSPPLHVRTHLLRHSNNHKTVRRYAIPAPRGIQDFLSGTPPFSYGFEVALKGIYGFNHSNHPHGANTPLHLSLLIVGRIAVSTVRRHKKREQRPVRAKAGRRRRSMSGGEGGETAIHRRVHPG